MPFCNWKCSLLTCLTLLMNRDMVLNCFGPSRMPWTMMTGLYPSARSPISGSSSRSSDSSGSSDAEDRGAEVRGFFISVRSAGVRLWTSNYSRSGQGTAHRLWPPNLMRSSTPRFLTIRLSVLSMRTIPAQLLLCSVRRFLTSLFRWVLKKKINQGLLIVDTTEHSHDETISYIQSKYSVRNNHSNPPKLTFLCH